MLDVQLHCSRELHISVDSTWVDEAGAKQRIVPIENNNSFVVFWLLLRGKPDFFVSELTE